jgi:hypothetical protein
MRAPGRLPAESGSASLSMSLGLGLLVVPVLLLVLTVPTWEARTVYARDAAAAGARVLATSDSWADGQVSAQALVDHMTAEDGLPSQQTSVAFSGSFTRGGEVSVAVTIEVPAGVIPGIGSFGAVHYTAVSTQHIDDYRSFG